MRKTFPVRRRLLHDDYISGLSVFQTHCFPAFFLQRCFENGYTFGMLIRSEKIIFYKNSGNKISTGYMDMVLVINH